MNNQIVKINNADLLVKEFKGQRVVTFKDIDELHQRVEGTAKSNFYENKGYFIENEDYFIIKKSQKYEIPTLEIPNRGITVLTESGYLMLVKSLQDDLAWQVQRELVNNYFRVKENTQTLNTSELSPELQMFKSIFDTVAKQQLEQKQMRKDIEDTKNQLQGIREVVAINSNDWKTDCKNLITKIAYKLGGIEHIQDVYKEVYSNLDKRLGTKLQVRLTNKRRRMADEGICKSKRDKLNYIGVIEDDKKLIEGYVAIVKELSIRYGVDMN